MKKYQTIIIALLAVAVTASCGGDSDGDNNESKTEANTNRNIDASNPAVGRCEVPRLHAGNSKFIVYRTSGTAFDADGVNFCIEWDRDLKSQRWACYVLTKQNVNSNGNKRWYATDSQSQEQYPYDLVNLTTSDYYMNGSVSDRRSDCFWSSGFDHGHICNSQDRLFSTEINKQTFYITNMQPQHKAFNGSAAEGGIWLDMENWVHSLASGNKMQATDTLFICKGGTIDNDSQILQRLYNKQIVPKYFYSAIVWKHTATGSYSGIAFWFEHNNNYPGSGKLTSYAVSIDELEKKTGLDFFCNLPDNIENKCEATASTLDFGL